MTSADKIKGKTKEIIAEVIGDGKLAEEGKEQQKQGEKPDDLSPAERLSKLS